jgi:hypothetical protein
VAKGRERDEIGSVRLSIFALAAMREIDAVIDEHKGDLKAVRTPTHAARTRRHAPARRACRYAPFALWKPLPA